MQVHIGIAANSSQDQDVECETIKSVDKRKGTRMKNSKVTKSTGYQQKVESYAILVGEEAAELSYPSIPVAKYDFLSTQTRSGATITDYKDASVTTEYIDLECDSEKDSR